MVLCVSVCECECVCVYMYIFETKRLFHVHVLCVHNWEHLIDECVYSRVCVCVCVCVSAGLMIGVL